MFIYDKDVFRAVEAKKREILDLMECEKNRIIRELSGLDHETMTRMRQLLADYNDIDYRNTTAFNNMVTEFNSIISNLKNYDDSLSEAKKQNEILVAKVNELLSDYNALVETVNGKADRDDIVYVTPQMFGAVGDGVTDDTTALQEAIDFCYENNMEFVIPYGVYRTQNITLKVNMRGLSNPIILFEEGCGFKNYDEANSIRYHIKKLDGITFESDKSSYWNSANAGEAYRADITDPAVIRKYGQRVFIGNTTTTPNNILSEDETEAKTGNGWWDKNYSQWTAENTEMLDDVETVFNNVDLSETNVISCPGGISISSCKFIGFSVGLTICGTYDSVITKTAFERCCVGIYTRDGGMIPNISSVDSKVTTLLVENCMFADIHDVGIYGHSFIESKVINNIFQPLRIGVVLRTGANNIISQNYFEVINTGVLFATDDCFGNEIFSNFTNGTYSVYSVCARHGMNNNVYKLIGNRKCKHFASGVNYSYDGTVEVLPDDMYYFYHNGNSIEREKTKSAVIKIVGKGSYISTTGINTTRKDNTFPSLKLSQTGFEFDGKEQILAVLPLTNNGLELLTHYMDDSGVYTSTYYHKKFDPESGSLVESNVGTDGNTLVIRVLFNDGYKD